MADDNEIELTEEQALNILEEYFNSESHSESDSELESNTQKPKEEIAKLSPEEKAARDKQMLESREEIKRLKFLEEEI